MSDLRREGEALTSCGDFKKIVGCGLTLFTGDPFHIAVGSLAPQNGFGFGLAFVEHYTPNENWRLSWNADAVATPGGSWRGGAYMKIVRTKREGITVLPAGSPAPTNFIREYPIVTVYAQGMSLERLFFYGLGQSSPDSGKSVYGQKQTIVGASAILPVLKPAILRTLRTSVVGGVNGRFMSLRGNTSEPVPSIDQLYDDSAAPGLSRQPNFTQFEEGVRFKPSTANGWLQFNYLLDFQQFLASEASHASFRRWSIDLRHEVPFYRTVSSTGPKDTNGPDECFVAVGSNTCPPVSYSRNRGGALTFRLFTSASTALSGNTVPFYLQPTLGGSDINGQPLLPSFDDYRFRGPKVIALQETIEHSIWGPFGAYFMADQGKVALATGDLDFAGLTHSFGVGLTVRAGGLPVMNFSFAWGPGGSHVISAVNASLLGGSSRPSQY
jgi:hypothetical protein